ncbi:MAG TPA: GNAT family N-acetyltransferase [Clostridia bacterium]|jgi:GNAT superfamily N-acetyltransferase|nr:GNAT family N-acetyltransferase [Clostridia bacterium]
MKKQKKYPLSQADLYQIHAYLEEATGQKLTLPNLKKDSKKGVYRFSSCDENITDYKEQFHLHINFEHYAGFEKPYLNLKYLRIPQSKRRQKLGTKIVKFLIEFLKAKGFEGINLVAKNRRAYLFWQSLGFQPLYGALMVYKLENDTKSESSFKQNNQQPLLSSIKDALKNLLYSSEKVG